MILFLTYVVNSLAKQAEHTEYEILRKKLLKSYFKELEKFINGG